MKLGKGIHNNRTAFCFLINEYDNILLNFNGYENNYHNSFRFGNTYPPIDYKQVQFAAYYNKLNQSLIFRNTNIMLSQYLSFSLVDKSFSRGVELNDNYKKSIIIVEPDKIAVMPYRETIYDYVFILTDTTYYSKKNN